jgi:hypothetical protein
MTYKEIFEILDGCNFVVNGLGQSEKPSEKQVKEARRQGRLTVGTDHIIIVSNDPYENFTCRSR